MTPEIRQQALISAILELDQAYLELESGTGIRQAPAVANLRCFDTAAVHVEYATDALQRAGCGELLKELGAPFLGGRFRSRSMTVYVLGKQLETARTRTLQRNIRSLRRQVAAHLPPALVPPLPEPVGDEAVRWLLRTPWFWWFWLALGLLSLWLSGYRF